MRERDAYSAMVSTSIVSKGSPPMSHFTITLQPEAAAGPVVELLVDRSNGAATIARTTVIGGGLAQIPAINLAAALQLAESFGPAVSNGHVRAPAAKKAVRKAITASPEEGVTSESEVPPKKAAKSAEPTAKRSYNRRPLEAELAAAWSQAGTADGIADAFGVPVATARRWIANAGLK